MSEPDVKRLIKRSRKKPPEGLVPERTLRSLIRTIAMEIRKEGLSTKQKLDLLRQQQRLAKQLRESVAASAAQ
jgi:hypothetical protein